MAKLKRPRMPRAVRSAIDRVLYWFTHGIRMIHAGEWALAALWLGYAENGIL